MLNPNRKLISWKQKSPVAPFARDMWANNFIVLIKAGKQNKRKINMPLYAASVRSGLEQSQKKKNKKLKEEGGEKLSLAKQPQ